MEQQTNEFQLLQISNENHDDYVDTIEDDAGALGEEYFCLGNDEGATDSSQALITNLENAMAKVKMPSYVTTRGRGRPKGRGKANTCVSNQNQQHDEAVLSFMNSVLSGIKEVQNQIAGLDAKCTRALDRLEALEIENKQLRDVNNAQSDKITQLEDRIEKLEWKEHCNQIIISSPQIQSMKDDTFQQEMVRHVSTVLSLPEDRLKLHSYRKIGKERKKALVTISDYQDRAKLFTTARTVKPDHFYINEALSEEKDKLLYDIRQYRKQSKKKFSVYSFKGRIYVKKTPEDDPVMVREVNEVKRIFETAAVTDPGIAQAEA